MGGNLSNCAATGQFQGEKAAPTDEVEPCFLIDIERQREAIYDFINSTDDGEDAKDSLMSLAYQLDMIIRNAPIRTRVDAAAKLRSVVKMFHEGPRTDETDEVVARQILRWLETDALPETISVNSAELGALNVEYQALTVLQRSLNAGYDEDLKLELERREQDFYRAVEKLPRSVATAPIRASAISLIHGAELDGFCADSECTDARIARQLIESLTGVV